MPWSTESVAASVDDATLERYRDNYGFAADVRLDRARVAEHWALERKLTAELLASTPEQRAAVSEKIYSTLYRSLKWHDDIPKKRSITEHYEAWVIAVGDTPKSVYEIGSGQGHLLRLLAAHGHTCVGSEITRHRGELYVDPNPRISWGITDGVHLDRFEAPGSFDIVISNQVVEHLHPDDIDEHLRAARSLLAPGGRYILSTPHPITGPHDVSRVFRSPWASGLHLKEYTWSELSRACKRAGFSRVAAATTVRLEPKIERFVGSRSRARLIAGGPYLVAMRVMEKVLGLIPGRTRQQRIARQLHAKRIFADNVFLMCQREAD